MLRKGFFTSRVSWGLGTVTSKRIIIHPLISRYDIELPIQISTSLDMKGCFTCGIYFWISLENRFHSDTIHWVLAYFRWTNMLVGYKRINWNSDLHVNRNKIDDIFSHKYIKKCFHYFNIKMEALVMLITYN